MTLIDDDGDDLGVTFPVVVIGAGACGLVAALSARDTGAEVVVLERDPVPAGSTALSSGMITAAATALQQAAGIKDDTPALFAADVQAKAAGRVDTALLAAICSQSGPTIDWLISRHSLALELVEGAPYPGHSRQRTHAPPSRKGSDLMADLLRAAAAADIDIVTNATATHLLRTGDTITGVQFQRPDGSTEQVGCRAIVLASSGFGGSPDMVKEYIPHMADAFYFGHVGNQGDALRWGQELGAACRDLGAFQGHGSVATPHGITVSWSFMTGGGLLVNAAGERFADEQLGSSELSALVCAQQGGRAWAVIDERLHNNALSFSDYQTLRDLGAIKSGATAAALARACVLPVEALEKTLHMKMKPSLTAPYFAIQVTGALLQTQGGLAIDTQARVCRADGLALPNLFAGGGAAQGISGIDGAGYLSCNGLLSAVTLGRIAGREAAKLL
jgi:succinate dehydrogenase/fumarate reductase flavoprotein subunit